MEPTQSGAEKSAKRKSDKKLVRGMAIASAACLVMIAVFLAIWMWFGPETELPEATDVPSQSDKSSSSKQGRVPLDHTGKVHALSPDDVDREQPLLQGPEAGQIVAPPRRDVTPGFALSPLHQTEPLTRTEGSPLPPPPKQEPLPEIFRKVVVEGPTELELGIGHNRILPVSLAYINPPADDRTCWFLGQESKCSSLATTALRRFIRRRAVSCDWVDGLDGQGAPSAGSDRQAARCYLGSGLKGRKPGEEPRGVTDIGSWLVRFGWADPIDDYYSDERQEARGQGRGMFATKESSDNPDARDAKQQIRELSATIDKAADAIAPLQSDIIGQDSGSLDLMAPSVVEEEKELPLPPGFEWQ